MKNLKLFLLAAILASNSITALADVDQAADCLTANIYFEARGEGIDGMKAIAALTMNRVKHKAFPNDVCSVVFQPKQFSWTHQHKTEHIQKVIEGRVSGFQPSDILAYQQANKIAYKAIQGHLDGFLPKWVISFHSLGVNPSWAGRMKYYGTIGQHVLYGFNKKEK
jgi:spore germination cell wall hydrolase CwlJ-like protein